MLSMSKSNIEKPVPWAQGDWRTLDREIRLSALCERTVCWPEHAEHFVVTFKTLCTHLSLQHFLNYLPIWQLSTVLFCFFYIVLFDGRVREMPSRGTVRGGSLLFSRKHKKAAKERTMTALSLSFQRTAVSLISSLRVCSLGLHVLSDLWQEDY